MSRSLPYLILTKDYKADYYECPGCRERIRYGFPDRLGIPESESPFYFMPLNCPECGHSLLWAGILYDAFDPFGMNEQDVDYQLQHPGEDINDYQIPYVYESMEFRIIYRNTTMIGSWNRWEKGFYLSVDRSEFEKSCFDALHVYVPEKKVFVPFDELYEENEERKEYLNFKEENRLYGIGPRWRTDDADLFECPFRRCRLISDNVDINRLRVKELIDRMDKVFDTDQYVFYRIMGEWCAENDNAVFLTEGRICYDRPGDIRYPLIVLWLQVDGENSFALFEIRNWDYVKKLRDEVNQCEENRNPNTPFIEDIRERYRKNTDQESGILLIGTVKVPRNENYFDVSVVRMNTMLERIYHKR